MMIATRSPDDIRRALIDESRDLSRVLTRGQKGATIHALNVACGGDYTRQLVLGWIFSGKIVLLSSKTLNEGQWAALYDWVALFEEDGEWNSSPTFKAEISEIISRIQSWVNTVSI